eukprot:SAG22_NODE_3760_length_1540_cov_1.234559_2_plen_339_part_00
MMMMMGVARLSGSAPAATAARHCPLALFRRSMAQHWHPQPRARSCSSGPTHGPPPPSTAAALAAAIGLPALAAVAGGVFFLSSSRGSSTNPPAAGVAGGRKTLTATAGGAGGTPGGSDSVITPAEWAALPAEQKVLRAAANIAVACRFATLVSLAAPAPSRGGGEPPAAAAPAPPPLSARVVDPHSPDTAGDWSIWLASHPGTRKVAELARDGRALLVYSSLPPHDAAGIGYVSIAGRCTIVTDLEQRKAHWKVGRVFPDRALQSPRKVPVKWLSLYGKWLSPAQDVVFIIGRGSQACACLSVCLAACLTFCLSCLPAGARRGNGFSSIRTGRAATTW